MPNYGWKGPGQTRELSHERASVPEVQAPAGPEVEGAPDDERQRLLRCTVPECGRKFRKAMILANHFNASHSDIKEDSDTWREYREEVWE